MVFTWIDRSARVVLCHLPRSNDGRRKEGKCATATWRARNHRCPQHENRFKQPHPEKKARCSVLKLPFPKLPFTGGGLLRVASCCFVVCCSLFAAHCLLLVGKCCWFLVSGNALLCSCYVTCSCAFLTSC